MKTLLNTLFVTTPRAWLRLEGQTLRVEVEREKRLQVPLHHLGSIVCFGDIMLTPALLHRCADEGRSVVYLTETGRFKARLEGPVNGNVLLRQAQFQALDNVEIATPIARACIAGKLRNARQVLLRSARDSKTEEDANALRDAAQRIAHIIEKLPTVAEVEVLRGYEGDAARLYFSVLSKAIAPAKRDSFPMNGRNRRPPRDRINALLSFLYAILLNDCRSALEGVGLDPQVGFLHVLRPGRPALALDLLEEFRAGIADRLALTLINRGQLTERDFDLREGPTASLNDDGRRTVLTAYQERKQEEIQHPLLETATPIGLLPHLQARLLARHLRGDLPEYLPWLSK